MIMERLILVCLLVGSIGKVTVYSPKSLQDEIRSRHKDGTIPSSLANFGNPPYGSRIIGRVFIPVHKDEKKACDPLTPIDFSSQDNETSASPIVLVNRGDCSFVSKVRHAQNIGAKAVLVVDDKSDSEHIDHEVINDDGSGGGITIPSFLIAKREGSLIRKHVTEEEEVVLILAFELGNKTETVDMTFWMSSGSNETLFFLSNFSEQIKTFPSGAVRFHPHYVLWYCAACKRTGFNNDTPDCVSGGQYCAPDPDNNGPLNGRNIALEDLRQICVLNQTKDSGEEAWFKYVAAVYKKCYKQGLEEDCAYKAMDGIVDAKKVKKCVNNSFTDGGDFRYVDNELLKKEKTAWLNRGPAFFPSIQVNNVTYKGTFSSQEVMLALCSAFKTPPENCVSILPAQATSTPVSFFKLALTILFVLGVLTGVLIIYRLWMQRDIHSEMKRQVTAAVSQYIALNDEGRRGRNAFT